MMRGPLSNPGFRLLFAGLAVSMVGDSLMLLVFAIWIKTLTDSNGAAGLVLLCVAVPAAASPLGGWVVDRVRRRHFLVCANAASALMLTPLFAVHDDRADVWMIYMVAVLYGVSSVTIAAALNGLLKELLGDEELAAANSMLQTVKEGLRLGGPLVGAVLFAAVGGAAIAAIDAGSFVLAASVIAAMRLRERRPYGTRPVWREEVLAGLRHLLTEPVLRRAMTAGAMAFLVIGLVESVGFAIVDQGLHRAPAFIGVLASAQGAGCIAGGVAAAVIIRTLGELAATAMGLSAFGSGCALCIPATLLTVMAGKALAGFGIALATVALTTVIQRRTPEPLVGRASTAMESLTSGPQTLSLAAGAVLISLVDYRVLLVTIVAGMLPAAGYLWHGRRLTSPRQQVRIIAAGMASPRTSRSSRPM